MVERLTYVTRYNIDVFVSLGTFVNWATNKIFNMNIHSHTHGHTIIKKKHKRKIFSHKVGTVTVKNEQQGSKRVIF